MVVPSKSFTVIGDADIDPDSPITTGLLNSYRDRDENLSSQLIGETSPFTAAQKHDHDGLNSALVAGTLSLIEHKQLSASATSVTFSGLDGDTDFHFRLLWRMKRTAAGSLTEVAFRPNGSFMTSSRNQTIKAATALDTLSGRIFGGATMGTIGRVGGVVDFVGVRTVEATTHAWVMTYQTFLDADTGAAAVFRHGGAAFTSGANLTSIVVDIGSGSSAFEIGSHFTLYRITKV